MTNKTAKKRKKESNDILRNIDALKCLEPMVTYYQWIFKSIRYLVGDENYTEENLARLSFHQVRSFRRYINADLEHFGLEFYLQRSFWAIDLHDQIKGKKTKKSKKRYTRYIQRMHENSGFRKIAESREITSYSYEDFLGETSQIFLVIHSHLVSINKALGVLYYCITELPFSSFTPTGKSEIRHLTTELNRIMRGLMVASHLQSQEEWQDDLVSYLMSVISHCSRFFRTIDQYYRTHKLRLVIFPIDSIENNISNPYSTGEVHEYPLTCNPISAGVYLEFLNAYQDISRHTMAVVRWSIRLHSRFYFVPRRILRAIAPI